jgi:hypothetical protein
MSVVGEQKLIVFMFRRELPCRQQEMVEEAVLPGIQVLMQVLCLVGQKLFYIIMEIY